MSEDFRVGRTIRLSSSINQRLVDLCEHLGTNPNSYLVNEIGKAISRDELAFRSHQSQAEFFGRLLQGFDQVKDEALTQSAPGSDS